MLENDLNSVNKAAWDAYQEDYMRFHLMHWPDYYEFFSKGGVRLDAFLIQALGDVSGLKLLDTCCACDAVQAFSWSNLGADVTACDITPSAIRIASENAKKIGLTLDFIIEDMQSLNSIQDDTFDIVFATYPVWLSDLSAACRAWGRVLKRGGRLLLHAEHPITYCLEEDDGKIVANKNYNIQAAQKYSKFTGTPMSEIGGGWETDLPSFEHFYRVCDMINAICEADLRILRVLEECPEKVNTVMKNLPADLVILAQK